MKDNKNAEMRQSFPFRRCLWWAVRLGLIGYALSLSLQFYRRQERIRQKTEERTGSRMPRAISEAIEQFYADYNKLPVPLNGSPTGSDTDTDTSPENRLVTIIADKEGPVADLQNPRNIDYMEGFKPASANRKDGPPWKYGLMSDATTEAPGIVDPWGNYFRIRLDSDGNKELANPNPDQVAEGRTKIIKRVLVWSAGKDGNWDTWADNHMSWD